MRINNLTAVVYDIETCDFESESTKLNISSQTLTVAITYDEKNQYQDWREENVNELIRYLLSFDKIIGFNIKSFDNRILDRYKLGSGKKLDSKSIDLLELIEKQLGRRLSLDSLVAATLNVKKTSNGALAAQWARAGKYQEIAAYCIKDVELTKNLFIHGLHNGEVVFEDKGEKRIVKVDWLNPQKSLPAEIKYVLLDKETGQEIKLDPENKEFFQALELVRSTNLNLFITGKAGTGKTTFLKYVKSAISKNTVIVAYTGVAAVNAGGQTIHSFFNISPQEPPFTPWDNRLRTKVIADDEDNTTIYSHFRYTKAKREILKSLEMLIIDEVSMVRADFLDVIDKILRAFGRNRNQPFGGVQVLLIGDTFQLPPIEGQEWDILGQFYQSPFFFSAQVFRDSEPLQIELKKIYRQNELEFISLLNRIRVNKPLDTDLELLNKKVRPITNKDFEDNYIVLCSTNRQVAEINTTRLSSLVGEEKIFKGSITGTFPESSCATNVNLGLKDGAQVMFLKNGAGYYNGKIGTVVSLEGNEILVQIKDSRGSLSVVKVEKSTWENAVFTFNSQTKKIERSVIGTFTQYPLKLAWAVTIHKSQGLTFDKVAIDINDFAPSGLTYVALSRCTTLNGLALKQPIQRRAIHTDRRVIEYAEQVAPETLVTEILNDGKANELYAMVREEIKKGEFDGAITTFLTALKHRNDLETDEFRRYVGFLLHGRMFYKSLSFQLGNHIGDLRFATAMKITELTDALRKTLQEKKELQVEAEELLRSLAGLKKERASQRHEVKKLSTEIENLKDKVKNLTADKQQLTSYADKQAKMIESAEKTIKIRDTQKKKLSLEVAKLEEMVLNEQIECERLQKLTWLQKLFGRK